MNSLEVVVVLESHSKVMEIIAMVRFLLVNNAVLVVVVVDVMIAYT